MQRTRVLLVDMHRLPRQIVRGLLARHGVEAVDSYGFPALADEVDLSGADLVIVGPEGNSARVWELLRDRPDTPVVAMVAEGEETFLFKRLGPLSAPRLTRLARGEAPA